MGPTESIQEFFDRDGFVRIPGFLSVEEVGEVEAQVEAYVREIVPTLPRSVAMYEDYALPETLKQVAIPYDDHPFFAQVRDRRAAELSRCLLRDEVVPRQTELFFKPPGVGKPTPPHQDGFYFCLSPNEALTVWVALDDMDEENGTLAYVAGSHRKGLISHAASGVLGFSQGLSESRLSDYGQVVTCRVQRGDALVHHSLTIHAAQANPSRRRRRAVGFVYYARRAGVDLEQQRHYEESLRRQREAAGVL